MNAWGKHGERMEERTKYTQGNARCKGKQTHDGGGGGGGGVGAQGVQWECRTHIVNAGHYVHQNVMELQSKGKRVKGKCTK